MSLGMSGFIGYYKDDLAKCLTQQIVLNIREVKVLWNIMC